MEQENRKELERVRRLLGIGYEELAREAGLSEVTVRRALKEESYRPRVRTVEAIREGLKKLIRKDEETGNIIHEKPGIYDITNI